jgi:hypothetical protein
LAPNGWYLQPGRVLVVAPPPCATARSPSDTGRVLYNLLTGHPDRAPHDLVFLADLTVELRAWPQQTWTTVGVSPRPPCWR